MIKGRAEEEEGETVVTSATIVRKTRSKEGFKVGHLWRSWANLLWVATTFRSLTENTTKKAGTYPTNRNSGPDNRLAKIARSAKW